MKLDAQVLEGFVNSCLAAKFDDRRETAAFHREIWELCCSDAKNVAIAAPRAHAKSTVVTHAYTLACVLFRERRYVVIVSDSESQAINFLNDIKSELRENEDIINLFGVQRFLKDSETEVVVEFDDGAKFKIIAKGAEQKMRGIKWDNLRPDLIILDDLENDELVMNQDRREKLRRWFYGTLMPIRSAYGIVRYIGTILHMDSQLERLMPKSNSKFTSTSELKIWNTNPKAYWKAVKYRAHNEDYSEILWPERFSVTELKQIRQDYVDQGLPEVYSQEYLNDPIDMSRSYFKKSDFIPITKQELDDINNKKKPLTYYVGTDFALSQKERADWSAFVVGAVDANNTLYVLDVLRQRMDSMEIVDTIIAMQSRYKPDLFVFEDEKITKAIGPFLNERMFQTGIFLSYTALNPTKDKLTRARSIQARMRIGGVRFLKHSEWYDAFESELTKFPRDRHDDQVDAFAYLGLILDKMVAAPTQDDLIEEENQRLRDEYNEDEGRSVWTGY